MLRSGKSHNKNKAFTLQILPYTPAELEDISRTLKFLETQAPQIHSVYQISLIHSKYPWVPGATQWHKIIKRFDPWVFNSFNTWTLREQVITWWDSVEQSTLLCFHLSCLPTPEAVWGARVLPELLKPTVFSSSAPAALCILMKELCLPKEQVL